MLDNSTVKTAYSGTIQSRKMSDGRVVSYHHSFNDDDNSGIIKQIISPNDIVLESHREDGTLEKKYNEQGEMIAEYYENGSPKTIVDENGVRKSYERNSNGDSYPSSCYLETCEYPDGTIERYHNGILRYRKASDGTREQYDCDGEYLYSCNNGHLATRDGNKFFIAPSGDRLIIVPYGTNGYSIFDMDGEDVDIDFNDYEIVRENIEEFI